MVLDPARLPAVVGDLPAPVVVLAPDGQATLNAAARELLALPERVELGALPAAAAARRALAGEPPPAETVDWGAAATARPLLVLWSPLPGGGAVGLALDATSAVAREREAARRADEFYGAIAHELRTPLTPILGWVRMLLHQRPDDAVLRRAAEVIERNVRLQARLVDEMLDISRISRGTLALVQRALDLRETCRAVVARARDGLGRRALTIVEEYGDEALWVAADPARLEQIVETLVGNALKHTPEGGRVEVTAARDGEEVCCVVSDTGHGLTPEALARVFELPPSPAGLRRGDGLGAALGIASHLAAAQGGRLHAESAGPGRGARFTLRLPYRAPA
jgi:signal transduction histidine kinase